MKFGGHLKRHGYKSSRDMVSILEHWAVQPCPNTGCWLWMGASSKGQYTDYAILTIDGKATYGHRFSWELANSKKIPDGMCVCHKCNTPLCVNPDHLYLGTYKENMQYMSECGRSTRGEKSYWAKLTEDDVRDIRKLCSEGWSQNTIAMAFEIRQTTVGDIVRRRRWAHI